MRHHAFHGWRRALKGTYGIPHCVYLLVYTVLYPLKPSRVATDGTGESVFRLGTGSSRTTWWIEWPASPGLPNGASLFVRKTKNLDSKVFRVSWRIPHSGPPCRMDGRAHVCMRSQRQWLRHPTCCVRPFRISSPEAKRMNAFSIQRTSRTLKSQYTQTPL